MTWDAGVLAVSTAALLAFGVAFHVSGLVRRMRGAAAQARQAVSAISDQALDDNAKEQLARRASLGLLRRFGLIVITAGGVLAAPCAVMLVGHVLGVASFRAVAAFSLSWEAIAGASALMLAAVWLAERH